MRREHATADGGRAATLAGIDEARAAVRRLGTPCVQWDRETGWRPVMKTAADRLGRLDALKAELRGSRLRRLEQLEREVGRSR